MDKTLSITTLILISLIPLAGVVLGIASGLDSHGQAGLGLLGLVFALIFQFIPPRGNKK